MKVCPKHGLNWVVGGSDLETGASLHHVHEEPRRDNIISIQQERGIYVT